MGKEKKKKKTTQKSKKIAPVPDTLYFFYKGLFKKHRLALFRDNINAQQKNIDQELVQSADKDHFFLKQDEGKGSFFNGEIGFVHSGILKIGAAFTFEILTGGFLALKLETKNAAFKKTDSFRSFLNQLNDLNFDKISKTKYDELKGEHPIKNKGKVEIRKKDHSPIC